MSHANTPRDWVRRAPQHGAVERIEAYFAGHGYDPHRHDTYAIGQTLAGVQSFRYRRSQRHSLPGGCLVLHPDELHDGEAGSQEGFRYRMLYVEPALIQRRLDIARRLMLGGQTLAEAALAAGFTDQSHMTRHFGQSYGLPPARWLRMLGRA